MLRFLFACFINLLRLFLLPLRLWQQRHSAPPGGWLRVSITGSVVEVAGEPSFLHQGPTPVSLHGLRELLELAAADPKVAGILFVVQPVHFGSATARSLRDILRRARAVGKRVACYLPDGGGTLEFFIGSAADTLILGPEAALTPAGFMIETPYVKQALARVGLQAEVYAQGRYKTAAEPLVLDEMSPAQREQLGAILDLAWEELIAALAQGRNVSEAQASEWVHRGFWTTQEALDARLVDACGYEDELMQILLKRDASALDEIEESFEATEDALRDIFEYGRRRSIRFKPFFRRKYLAVVEVNGTIVGKSLGPFAGAIEEEVRAALTHAREDRAAKGVIVHINSRGGGAAASDRLRHELERVAKKKPVIAYFSDAAASGGYMIGVAAKRIVCQPTTLTGSIGVIGARIPLGPLLERFGISRASLKRGAHADLHSATRPLGPEERALIDKELRAIYDGFLKAVAHGRQREVAAIAALAEGRVWSGKAAQEHGLVDELGGFDRALELLRGELGPKAARMPVSLLEARKGSMVRVLGLLPRGAAHSGMRLELPHIVDLLDHPSLWAWCPVYLRTRRAARRG